MRFKASASSIDSIIRLPLTPGFMLEVVVVEAGELKRKFIRCSHGSTCFSSFWLVVHSCVAIANQEPICLLTQLLTMTRTHKFPSLFDKEGDHLQRVDGHRQLVHHPAPKDNQEGGRCGKKVREKSTEEKIELGQERERERELKTIPFRLRWLSDGE